MNHKHSLELEASHVIIAKNSNRREILPDWIHSQSLKMTFKVSFYNNTTCILKRKLVFEFSRLFVFVLICQVHPMQQLTFTKTRPVL